MTPEEKRELNEKLDKILEAIYGNGKPGIMTRLALIEDRQNRMEAEKASQNKDLKSVVTPLVVQVIGAGIAFTAYLIAGHALGVLH